MIIPSKHNPVWFFQPNDYLDRGLNKNYYERGRYFKPWPAGNSIIFYVYSDQGNAVFAGATDCETGITISTTSGYTSLGNNLYKVFVVMPAAYTKAFYVEAYAVTLPGTQMKKTLYSSTATIVGSLGLDTVRGGIFRIKENCYPSNAIIPVNITSLTQPIMYWVYRVDPHNMQKKELVKSGSNSSLVGTAGAQILNLDLQIGRVFWNPGDLLMVTISTQGVDIATFNYRNGAGEQDPDGWYYSVIAGYEPHTQLPDWQILSLDYIQSEKMIQVNDPMILVKYSNVKTVDYVPGGEQLATWIRGNFWQPTFPAEFEDIEVVPGQFTRLRNEWNRTRKFETDYMPGYAHENFAHILGSDNVNIDGTDVIQREQYSMDYPNRHYGLVKGQVILTEKKSIIRNII